MITGKLLQSLEHYLEWKKDHDVARERYEGHSWDWHGRAYIDSMEKAANEFESALEEYIEQRVKKQKEDK